MLTIKKAWNSFLDTLAFFSCLVPARYYTGTSFPHCIPWFGSAGLCIALLASLVAFLAHSFSLPAHFSCWLAGFCWSFSELVLSRALHWDGLADLADALGSFRQGEGFWEVLKDSRIGTFGVLALMTIFFAQVLLAATHIAQEQWWPLLLAPAWARGISALLLVYVPAKNKQSLGGKFSVFQNRFLHRLCLFFAFVTLCLLWKLGHPIVLCLVQTALLFLLARIARKAGGISGDFIGASIELSQTAFLFCSL